MRPSRPCNPYGQTKLMGETVLRDFTDVHGMSGAFQSEAAVYGRAGMACGRCGKPVRRVVQGQRSTYFCAACQRR